MGDFKENIKPFFWVEHKNSVSACLNAGSFKPEIFETRADEGFEGNGYDWTSLAKVFLEERYTDLTDKVKFDPEAAMFCVYSSDPDALKAFIVAFKEACENETLIQDVFSRAELD
ncbi:immunity 51 family protein [Sphingobacterium sp. SYP-B4668]|uniref:immunity 51 family protein n=1 Tax=Sphingobacterium sp. SYP-B4668 TaxID=2996035 RepID=UPI0022DDD18B|nr:immunity 51 family protein [Sphingobacterium sp. SYP-B4668]